MATTRTSSNLIGNTVVPATVNPGGGTVSGILDMSASGVVEGVIIGALLPGSTAPTAQVTVKYEVSLDGTNYATVVTVSYPLLASTAATFQYDPPDCAQKVRVTITNPDASYGINTYALGATLTFS